MRTPLGLAAATALVLVTGCADETQTLASDACDLFEEAFGEDADMETMVGMQQEMQDLAERTEAADVSAEEMQQAIRDECPEVMDAMEGFAPQP